MSDKPIHLLAICGSERGGGNTDLVLEHTRSLVEARGATFETIHLREARFSPCSPCGNCNTRPEPCAVDDDMPALIERMRGADGLIYATPVHAFGMAHLMQMFVERAGVGYLRFERPLANKVGGVIVVSRRYNDATVHHQLVDNLLLNRMILVGSGFPALVRNTGPGPALADTEGLDALARMVDRMVDMCLLLRTQPGTTDTVLRLRDPNERVPVTPAGTSLPEVRGREEETVVRAMALPDVGELVTSAAPARGYGRSADTAPDTRTDS